MYDLRILVVDDNPSVRTSLDTLLRGEGYEVSEAGDGTEALLELQRNPPSLVLLDLNMPGVDGLTVLGMMRSREIQIPVILISEDRNAVQAASNDPVVGFCPKPFDPDSLTIAVATILHPPELPAIHGMTGATAFH